MLITVADLTTYLGAGAGSYTAAQLAAIVAWADAAVKRYCERDLEATDYRSWLRVNDGTLFLPDYPIIQLYRATADIEDVATITNAATDAAHISAAIANGLLALRVVGGVLASNNTLSLSTYASMALLAAAVNALTAATGFSMIVEEERDPRDLRPFTAGIQPGGFCYLEAPYNVVDTIWDIDYEVGIIKGGWQGWVFVDYSAGYTVIPADLMGACLGIAADALRLAASGGTIMQSERIGDYSYTLGNALSTSELGLLQPYSFILDSYKKRGLTTVLV
jgi:hypothetical protein